MPPRLVLYHQTHYHEGRFVSILPLLHQGTAITHVILAAIHLNPTPGHVTLNNDAYDAPAHAPVWAEARALQAAGIAVLGMLGGAARGTFALLDGPDDARFRAHYGPLRDMVRWAGLDGLDLDVEEDMSLAGAVRLVVALKDDFGPDFVVTMAPTASALMGGPHLSGFDYALLEEIVGDYVAWYNTQFYNGWGSVQGMADMERIVERGWDLNKVVLGTLTNSGNGNGWVEAKRVGAVLRECSRRYGCVGGVMGWEYFNAVVGGSIAEDTAGSPWRWAHVMGEALWPADG